MLVDIEIHQRTQNRKGLDTALRAIMNDGGVITEDWELERAFSVGDKALGLPILEQLYAKMKDKPVSVDLDKLWKALGVSQQDGVANFDDRAPLAPIREAISTGKPVKLQDTKFSLESLMSTK